MRTPCSIVRNHLFFCLASLSLIACQASPSEVDGSAAGAGIVETSASEVEVSTQTLGNSASHQLPVQGSFTDPIVDFEPMGSGMIYSMRLQTGSLVDRIITYWYEPSQTDNRYREGDALEVSTLGGAGGTLQAGQNCQAGYAAIGLWGRAGRWIDSLGLICARIKSDGNPDFSISFQLNPFQGGSGGVSFYEACDQGEWLGTIKAWSVRKPSTTNDVVTAVQGVCFPAH